MKLEANTHSMFKNYAKLSNSIFQNVGKHIVDRSIFRTVHIKLFWMSIKECMFIEFLCQLARLRDTQM